MCRQCEVLVNYHDFVLFFGLAVLNQTEELATFSSGPRNNSGQCSHGTKWKNAGGSAAAELIWHQWCPPHTQMYWYSKFCSCCISSCLLVYLFTLPAFLKMKCTLYQPLPHYKVCLGITVRQEVIEPFNGFPLFSSLQTHK